MFAVVRTGGKQYKVAQNDKLAVEKLDGQVGDTVILEDVLMLFDGNNTECYPKGISVKAKILDQYRTKKVIIFKKNRRHNYRRKKGHRQEMTFLSIEGIA